MKITLISTENEKFAYAYALEKAVQDCQNTSSINLYDRVDDFCKKMSEFRWLLAESRDNLNVDDIDGRVKFRFIESSGDATILPAAFESNEFHLFPSKRIDTLSGYVKFLLAVQSSKCERCIIIDEIDRIPSGESTWIDSKGLIISMFPPESILTVSSHPASRQFELQRRLDKRIVETVKMEWIKDRMQFKENK